MFMRFERENNVSYLVLDRSDKETESNGQNNSIDECSEFEYKMIKNNTIESLLSVQRRIIDGRDIYYYDVTSKQQMSTLHSYVQISLEDVRMICESIAVMVQNINMYMLDLAKVILNPKYMYVDISEKRVQFVYYPCKRQEEDDCDDSIRRLFEYILEHFDHSVEKEQLMTMYMVYQKVVQKEYNLESFNELVRECSLEIQKEEKEKEKEEKHGNNNDEALIGDLTEQEELHSEKIGVNKIPISAVPAENIGDEVEVRDEQLLKYQKIIKAISIAMIILGVLKIVVPGIIPLPINITASALLVVLGTAVLTGISAIPKYMFVKMQPRHSSQKYEVTIPPHSEFEPLRNDLSTEVIQMHEPQTMLLSDYINNIKSGGNISGKITLISQETHELLEIIKFPCLIGSMGEKCDKVVPKKLISRLHCCIADSKEGYYIEDMNSTNGTFVNEKRLTPNNRHILNNGDKVRLATYVYEVEIS